MAVVNRSFQQRERDLKTTRRGETANGGEMTVGDWRYGGADRRQSLIREGEGKLY